MAAEGHTLSYTDVTIAAVAQPKSDKMQHSATPNQFS
jgi:hypothetical protein